MASPPPTTDGKTMSDPQSLKSMGLKATFPRLNGKARIVAAAIRRKATARKLTTLKRKGADKAATYLTNKAPYLDYPTALSNGWPVNSVK